MTPPASDRDVEDEARGGSRHRRRRRRGPVTEARVLAVLAAVGAALAGTAPTGTAVVDPLLAAGFAAAVTLASARARRWPVLGLPVAALALASGWTFAFAIGSGVAALVHSSRRRRVHHWGAATAALAMQAMLRAPDIGPHGLTALIVVVAVTPPLVSGYRMCHSGERRWIRRVAIVGGAAVALVGIAYGVLVLSVASDIQRATSDSRTGLAATRRGETDLARSSFAQAATSFERADRVLNAWWAAPARGVPVLAQHARALGGAADEGHRLTLTAGETVEAADYQQLRYTGGQFDLARIASVREPLGRTITSIEEVRRGLVDDDSAWLLPPLARGLDDLDAELATAQDEADLADQAIAAAPGLLGGEGPRRYLVTFVTPAELRGSGGFMGGWAELTAVDGELRLARSGPVQDLIDATPPEGIEITGPEEYLTRFGQFVGGPLFIGDYGYSPHFPHSAEVMSQMYPQVGGSEVDGVISIDPIALAALLTFTGPIEVEGFGRTLSADDAAEFLLRDNYVLFPDDATQNDALAELLELTFDELTTGDLPGPRAVSEVLADPTRAGRIRLWSPRPDEQALFTRLGATGALPAPRAGHDFLALSSQNSGNNKIDVFQSRDIDYRVTVAQDGTLQATARVTVRNDPPLDGSAPDYVIGNSQGDPLGTNRMLLSVHTPHLLEAARIDGTPIGVESQIEAGHRVYTAVVVVPPGGAVTLEVELSGALALGDRYVLDLAPHPTVTSDRLRARVTVGGRDLGTVEDVEILDRRQIRIGP